jgi:hypothetical protein
MDLHRKSCFNCTNAIVYPGHAGSYYDPPEALQAL